MIYCVTYDLLNEGTKVIESENDIEIFDSLQELAEDKSILEHIFETMEKDGKITKEGIFNYFNFDEDILTIVGESDSIENFMRDNIIITFEQAKFYIEKNVIYLFRNYQHGKNILLAEFEGFENKEEVREYIYQNNLQFSDIGGNEYERLNNTYMYDFNDNFDTEDLNAVLTCEEVETFCK